MFRKISKPAVEVTEPSHRRAAGDAAWMIAFFAIITSGIVFFFWQMAEYGMLVH
jgi:hypothetical protein